MLNDLIVPCARDERQQQYCIKQLMISTEIEYYHIFCWRKNETTEHLYKVTIIWRYST